MTQNEKTDAPPAPRRRRPQVIRMDELYEQGEVMARMRWGRWAWRKAVKAGLTVHHCHGKTYALGRDVADYITSASK